MPTSKKRNPGRPRKNRKGKQKKTLPKYGIVYPSIKTNGNHKTKTKYLASKKLLPLQIKSMVERLIALRKETIRLYSQISKRLLGFI